MRIGELLALQIKDVDLKNKTIDINGTLHRIKCNTGFGYKDTTKTTGSKRNITINSRTAKVLKR